jgi:single-strand DNA-binding protein
MSINQVFIKGNITDAPELSYTGKGQAVAKFTVALNHEYKPKDKPSVKRVCFIKVTTWNKQAESCAQYLEKGQEVFVTGRLNQDIWEKDGKKFNQINIVANSGGVDFGRKSTHSAERDNQAPPDDATGQDEPSTENLEPPA